MLAAVGCTKQVAGTAQPDPEQAAACGQRGRLRHHRRLRQRPEPRSRSTPNRNATTARTYRHDFGDQLAYYIGVGQLEVTYRPMTFLDDKTDGYSAQVSNALFLAAESRA